jgi:hypothetical protein
MGVASENVLKLVCNILSKICIAIYIQTKILVMRVLTKIDEFLATKSNKPAPSTNPGGPGTKPATTPGTKPSAPVKPAGPIRREKPGADPSPKATAEEVVERFLIELKKAKAPIQFDISKLKARYND